MSGAQRPRSDHTSRPSLEFNPDSPHSLCFFDLDGTLTDSNTTYAFIRFVLIRRSFTRYLFFTLLWRPVALITELLTSLFNPRIDLFKVTMVRFLDGIPRGRIHEYGLCFSGLIAKEMRSGDRVGLFELLDHLRKLSNVFILTRTIEPMQHLQEFLGVRVVTSELRYDESLRVCGISAEVDKHAVVRNIVLKQGLRPYLVVSDDYHDLMDIFPLRLKVINSTSRGKFRLLRVERCVN